MAVALSCITQALQLEREEQQIATARDSDDLRVPNSPGFFSYSSLAIRGPWPQGDCHSEIKKTTETFVPALSRPLLQTIEFSSLGIAVEIQSAGYELDQTGRVGVPEYGSFDSPAGPLASLTIRLDDSAPRSLEHSVRNRLHVAVLSLQIASQQLQRGIGTPAMINEVQGALAELAEIDRQASASGPT